MIKSALRRCPSALLALGLLATTAHAESQLSSSKSVPFRLTKVDVAALQAPPSGGVIAESSVSETSTSEDLSEQKQALDGEVRYAKAKLAAAHRRLDLQTAAGNVEQADKSEQEIKTWESRLSESKAKLAQVNQEIAGSEKTSGAANRDLVVPGQNLELFVVEDPSFNGRYQVRRGGYIILPQVGRIPVAGKTVDDAEAAVKRALQASQLQRATVMLEPVSGSDVESGPNIYLSGEFEHPRPYRIPVGTSSTLVSVILSSGGVTSRADLTRVRVMRMAANKGLVEEVNVKKILDGSGLGSDITLSEGDVVVVPVRGEDLVYVTGKVQKQGSYRLLAGEKLSAYGVILQSGGFSRFANQRKVYVLRAMPDGTKVKLPVDVVAIQRGQHPDVPLQTNDIVVIPEKFWSF